MSEGVEVEFIVLTSTSGEYVVLPAAVLEGFGVPDEARDAVDQKVQETFEARRSRSGWGFAGAFRASVSPSWWESVSKLLANGTGASMHACPVEHRSSETNAIAV